MAFSKILQTQIEVTDESESPAHSLSLWITVQSLAATWNQTLNNATGQWSGELSIFLFSFG